MKSGAGELLTLFGHSRSTITVEAEFVLFPDMGQQNHVIALALTCETAPPCAITTSGYLQNLAHTANRKGLLPGLHECKPHHLWLTKKTVAFLGFPSPHAVSGSPCEDG
jgi:hypothetical protein